MKNIELLAQFNFVTLVNDNKYTKFTCIMTLTTHISIITDPSHRLDINLSVAMETDLLQSPNPGATVQVLQHQGVPESCNKEVSN